MWFQTDISQFVTKADLAHLASKADLHQELHALTWRFIKLILTLLIGQTSLILGAIYYMLSHPPK